MRNSLLGNTIENRVDIKLVTDEKQASILAAQIIYDKCTIFDKNLVAIHMQKTTLHYDKPMF